MEYMYNMRGAVNNQSFCSMTTCPMMNMQVQAMPGYMNYNMMPNSYLGYRGIHEAPIRAGQINPYFYQVEMKPVAIQEITE